MNVAKCVEMETLVGTYAQIETPECARPYWARAPSTSPLGRRALAAASAPSAR